MALHSFSALWIAQNATCVRLKKWCCRGFQIWTLTSDCEIRIKNFKVQSSKLKVRSERSKLKFRSAWNTAFSNLRKSHFGLVKRLNMSSKWYLRTWILALSNSSKSHFELVKREKLSWMWNVSIWNVAFSILCKSHFRLVKRRKMSSKWDAITWSINFSHRPVNSFDAFRPAENVPCVSLKKRYFKEWKCTLNSFSASWLAPNASCLSLKKRCFKCFEIWPLTFHFWPWTLNF